MTGVAEPAISDPATIAPAITVVVVNYNGSDYLRGCLASLSRQTFTDFETIVVDNASSDDSLTRIVEQPAHITILRQDKNLGFAGGNNVGARAGRGRWLALLNPDAEAAPDWLAAMMRAVELRPTHRMVACLQISLHAPDKLDGAGDCYLAYGYGWRGGFGHALRDAPGAGECFAPCGAAALYPRDLFLESGGFDERYFCYHEDVDIAFRLRLRGERCQYVPDAIVRHAGSGISGRSSAFAVFYGVRNGVWTYAKNMPGRLLLVTMPLWFVGSLMLLARGAMRGAFVPTLRGFAAAFAGLGPALKMRRELKAKRRAPLGKLVAALTWNPFSYLGRSIQVRPFPDNQPEILSTSAKARNR
jgi:N-acetylglucosaminyl-diphospho-decaprenol L-rhamnosyltransferase